MKKEGKKMAVLTSKHSPVIFLKKTDADKLFKHKTKPEITSRILRESSQFRQLLINDEKKKRNESI